MNQLAAIRHAVERVVARNGRGLLVTVVSTRCDQPLVTGDHLRRLVGTNAPIVATAYARTAGVPAGFAPQYRKELLALTGDRGARSIIERHGAEVTTIPFEDASVDIDREEDIPTAR